MSIAPSEEAAAILNHYFAQLAKRAGLKWTERNQEDIERACELLSDAEEPVDELPPYEPPIHSDRQTVVLERDEPADYGDPNFARWRGQRRYAEEEDVRRLVRR